MRKQNPLQFQAIRFNLPDDPPGIIDVYKRQGSGSSENMTLNSYFALLGDVLSENTYDLVTTEADIKLLDVYKRQP